MTKPKQNEAKTDYLKRCTATAMTDGQSSDQAFAVCNRSWDDSQNLRAPLSLHVPVELAKNENGEPINEFMITGYTGQVVELGWWGRFLFDLEGMKFSQKIPVLREHARDRVVGYSTKTWVDGQNLLFQGKFSTKTQDGREIKELADDGFPWQASVGIWPQKIKVLDTAKDTAVVNGQEVSGPLEIWLESKVKEVSFVALGADDQTAAIGLNLAELDKVPVSIERAEIKKEEVPMELTLALLEKDAPALLEDVRAAAQELGVQEGMTAGGAAERQRVLELLALGGSLELTREVIETGLSLADGKLKIADDKLQRAEKLAEMSQAAPAPVGSQPPVDGMELSAAEAALCAQLGIEPEKFLASKKELAKRGK